MKKWLVSFLSVLLLVGCSKKEENQSERKTIRFSDPSVVDKRFSAMQTEGLVSFTAEAGWFAILTPESGTKALSWVSLDPSSGSAGAASIRIVLQPNLSGKDRTATMTISCRGAETVLTLVQSALTESGELPGIRYRANGGPWVSSLAGQPEQVGMIEVKSQGGMLTAEDLQQIALHQPMAVDLGKVDFETGVFPATFSESALQRIVLPLNITKLTEGAFQDCLQLTEVLLPDGLQKIGALAFRSTGLSCIKLPGSLISIGYGTFSDCLSLLTVDLPESLSMIGEFAFRGCAKLEKATLGGDVKEIPEGMFSGCISLPEVTLSQSTTRIGERAFEACTALERIILSENIEQIGNYAFSGCKNLEYIVLGSRLKRIGNYAFANTGLAHVTFPGSLTAVGKFAFSFSAVQDIVFVDGPDSLSIGESAFSECKNLKKATLGSKMNEVPVRMFERCLGLSEVVLSPGITRIEAHAFEVCSALERIMLPESVEWIGDYVFGGCGSLERVSMGSRLKKIGDRAFLLCRRLNTIVCRAETPPGLGREAFLQAGEAASSKSCRVPRGSVEAYRDDAGWQFLENVMGFGFMPSAAE